MSHIVIEAVQREGVQLSWNWPERAKRCALYWADRCHRGTRFELLCVLGCAEKARAFLRRATHQPYYFILRSSEDERAHFPESCCAEPGEFIAESPTAYYPSVQTERLDRGLVAVHTEQGVFLSWRLLLHEVFDFDRESRSLCGPEFVIYKNGRLLTRLAGGLSYLDMEGKVGDVYQVRASLPAKQQELCCWEDETKCLPVSATAQAYLSIPLQIPAGGVSPAGEVYSYSANDVSVADVDGDGAYEYIVKWEPSNSHDVSIKGYTGNCILDCYKLEGRLLWRLDMGPNIRAGAHYTQFMCYDFDGDGRAELCVKTAPGTNMSFYDAQGQLTEKRYISMPMEDIAAGFSHDDNYVCSAEDYRAYLIERFRHWQEEPEVVSGSWPQTLETCFGLTPRCIYPLSETDAAALVDYFLDVYVPARSAKNELRKFEGFIFKGPEYLSVFDGGGRELHTLPFPFPREDDGLRWGDYAMPRIEPCNRVDRFLSGVAYLDGERPSLLICRGYYTRSCIAAYDLRNGKLCERFRVDSGHVPMRNPFCDHPHLGRGSSPVFGRLAGQGNHSLSTADVDGDGFMEIIYGAAVIDHDGSLLYSSEGRLPDGRMAKLGHGDAMHVGQLDPDRCGLEIFNVFEGAKEAPYGFALRKAESGEVIFGEYAETDLGRCMVGDISPQQRGMSLWVNQVGTYNCHGEKLSTQTLGSNMSIRFAEDYSTQIVDGEDYLHQKASGVVQDYTHGIMLKPEGTATNNGTKGNPCLVADVLGDYREELLLRSEDSRELRIYTALTPSEHRLFCLMQDAQYRCGIAWQNNCYNQPTYPGFYYGSDLEAENILPAMKRRPTIWLAGDSLSQAYAPELRPQAGWGEYLLPAIDEISTWSCDENALETRAKATAHLKNPGDAKATAHFENPGDVGASPAAYYQARHREDCPFEQQLRYESRHFIVENCSMGARSTRTFRLEGRWLDILTHVKQRDIVLLQFGHNDASSECPERYSSPEAYAENLRQFIEEARAAGARPVLVTPIAFRRQAAPFAGEAEDIRQRLPQYVAAMRTVAADTQTELIDLWTQTEALQSALSEAECRRLYVSDGVHLTQEGARRYAVLAAKQLLRLWKTPGKEL